MYSFWEIVILGFGGPIVLLLIGWITTSVFTSIQISTLKVSSKYVDSIKVTSEGMKMPANLLQNSKQVKIRKLKNIYILIPSNKEF